MVFFYAEIIMLRSSQIITYSPQEQINILYYFLEDAKKTLQSMITVADEQKIITLLNQQNMIVECQQALRRIQKDKDKDDSKKLIDAKNRVNSLLIRLEGEQEDGEILNFLKENGLFRVLYRNPVIKGEKDDHLYSIVKSSFKGIFVTAPIIALFASTMFFTAPIWLTAIATGLFTGATIYLSGILYGVINDLFATSMNLSYFVLGHGENQKSVLRTNDKISQAIAWGVLAPFIPSLFAAVLFTIAITVTAFFAPVATFILPLMTIIMPVLALSANLLAHKLKPILQNLGNWDTMKEELNPYQIAGLKYQSPNAEHVGAWWANGLRNGFGYVTLPIIAVSALVTIITLSVCGLIPIVLLSPLLAVALPAIGAALVCIGLIAGGIYLYMNRNNQSDDRYRLEFDSEQVVPDLYLEEDQAYVTKIIEDHSEAKLVLENFALRSSPQGIFASTAQNTDETQQSGEQDLLIDIGSASLRMKEVTL